MTNSWKSLTKKRNNLTLPGMHLDRDIEMGREGRRRLCWLLKNEAQSPAVFTRIRLFYSNGWYCWVTLLIKMFLLSQSLWCVLISSTLKDIFLPLYFSFIMCACSSAWSLLFLYFLQQADLQTATAFLTCFELVAFSIESLQTFLCIEEYIA